MIAINEATITRTDRRFRWRGLIGGAVLLPLGLLALFSEPLIPAGSWVSQSLNLAGFVCFAAGTTWRFWATLYIGGRKERFLVNEGPYSMCRNPLYFGSFLIALSSALFLQSLSFGVGLLMVSVFYALATVPAEEKFLAERLGDDYEQYRRQVPRFWPRFSLFQTQPTVEVVVKGLRRECWRAFRGWVWLPVLAFAAAQCRGASWWPHLFPFY